MARLFGTDGIRGVAGRDLTAEFAFHLGQSVGELIHEEKWDRRLFIGRDSRISGDMLESAMIAGAMSTGIDVHVTGITPTPVIAFLTRHFEYPFGCVISASHNPIEDNGIKFFDRRGMKIEDRIEDRLEKLVVTKASDRRQITGVGIGTRYDAASKIDEYVRHLMDIGQDKIGGIKIVVDGAHGAGCTLAPSVFQLLGAVVTPLNCLVDGIKINVNCGATSIKSCQEMVKKVKADIGIALDGDADRAILIDERGEMVDGDQVLAMWGLHLLDKNELPAKTVVGTVLSNKGLEVVLEQAGGNLLRAPVGDKYVLREMIANGATIGGEQSGHLIFLDHHTTGDGILTALMVAILMRETGMKLSDLALQMVRFPQVQLNIAIADKNAALNDSEVAKGIEGLSAELDKTNGRLLVRPSGTESVIRVMTEAPDEGEARRKAEQAIELFRRFSENGQVTELQKR